VGLLLINSLEGESGSKGLFFGPSRFAPRAAVGQIAVEFRVADIRAWPHAARVVIVRGRSEKVARRVPQCRLDPVAVAPVAVPHSAEVAGLHELDDLGLVVGDAGVARAAVEPLDALEVGRDFCRNVARMRDGKGFTV
jgi:hypothetical protein